MGCEDDSEEDDCDDDYDEFDDFDDSEENGEYENNSLTTPNRHLSHGNRRRQRPPPRRKRTWRNSSTVAAPTVHMRHIASGTTFSWRTAGIKDTGGTELHEGASYRLVATVKDVVPGVAGAAGGVGVTRCRLTLVTPDAV